MISHDDRAPSPTDPPFDGITGEMAPDLADGSGDETSDDTQGHGMLDAELGRQINREHVREADRNVRDGARVREARKGSDGGFLKRFSRR